MAVCEESSPFEEPQVRHGLTSSLLHPRHHASYALNGHPPLRRLQAPTSPPVAMSVKEPRVRRRKGMGAPIQRSIRSPKVCVRVCVSVYDQCLINERQTEVQQNGYRSIWVQLSWELSILYEVILFVIARVEPGVHRLHRHRPAPVYGRHPQQQPQRPHDAAKTGAGHDRLHHDQ